MRINIEKIKAKNFFSIGNNGIEFDFRKGLFRVTGDNKDSNGRNGAGKSVVLCETLAFVLYGKPIRKITKDEVINTTNEKTCEVEIHFNKQNDKYIITRGIKPNYIRINKNGEDLLENANMKTTQKEIDRILGSDFQTFTHLLVMSNSYSTPFMDLDSNKKRSIIEDVLGISVLGKMTDLIKRDHLELKSNLAMQEKECEYLLRSYNELKERNEELKDKSDKFEQDKENEIKEIEDTIEVYKDKLERIESKLKEKVDHDSELTKINEDKQELLLKVKELKTENSLFTTDIKKYVKKIESLKDKPVCPLCNTETNSDHVMEHITELKDNIKTKKGTIDNNKNNIQDYNLNISELEEEYDSIKSNKSKFTKIVDKQKEIENILTNTESKLDDVKNKTNDIFDLICEDKEKDKLEEYKVNIDKVTELSTKFKNLSFMKKVLSDDGIKNYIIKKVITYWNMKVNQYLSEMNVNFTIIFDEYLNVTIKSRNRDILSYHNFSGGERARIDVSILLAMLDLSKLQNNIDLNLMVIDELFDSAIDTTGREEILSLFKNKSVKEEKSIYVISHSADLPIDLFDKEVTIYKQNGFTHL